MEEDMEVELPVFEAREVDLDYEFDAARFFDFTREESLAEAREAEHWFDSAPNYPPSPFVVRLVSREEGFLESANSASKSEVTSSLENYSNNGVGHVFSAIDVEDRDCIGIGKGNCTNLQGNLQKVQNKLLELATGLKFYDHISDDKVKVKTKSAKPCVPRSSTLMKPTKSQLAKQNLPAEAGNFRFQTLPVHNSERSLCNSSVVESQAAKRQKLERGHLHKVTDIKQQISLVHKAPKKDAAADKTSAYARLKLTIPREPELETAHRAERTRPKSNADEEHVTVASRRFKARPLNRKIFEPPTMPIPKKTTPKLPEFQEFHLRTLERAMQHTSAVSSSLLQGTDTVKELAKPSPFCVIGHENKESGRPSRNIAPKQDGCDVMQNFKARPLNKKIFSSKGDIGVFRNSKREATVPMEFNLQTDKRAPQNPPIELFSQLSLASELLPNNRSQWKLPQPPCISTKGSKENRLNSLQPGFELKQLVKERPLIFGGKHNRLGNDGRISEAGANVSARRSLGIR